jgi:hypothetical protein
MGDAGKPPRLEHDPDQRLIDDRRRPAPLRDQNLVRHVALPVSRPPLAAAACVYGAAGVGARLALLKAEGTKSTA